MPRLPIAVIAPPCAPVLGMTVGEGLALEDGWTVGTVAPAPSRIRTWPAGTDALGVAVAPNSLAILLALGAAPVPYWMAVVDLVAVFPVLPATYPPRTSAARTRAAR